MVRKIALGLIWVIFVTYTLWLASLDRSDTWDLAPKLLTFRWGEVNAIIPAILCRMGVWPMIYACLMFFDGRMQKFRLWPLILSGRTQRELFACYLI